MDYFPYCLTGLLNNLTIITMINDDDRIADFIDAEVRLFEQYNEYVSSMGAMDFDTWLHTPTDLHEDDDLPF